MRIALISYEYPPETGLGGIGTYTQQAARMLEARGHSVEVFAGALVETTSTQEGEIALHRVFSPSRAYFPDKVFEVFRQRHSASPFDIIEGPEFMADSFAIRTRFPDVPHVIKLHTPSFLLGKLFLGNVGLVQKVRFILGGLMRGKLPQPYWRYEKNKDREYQLTQSVPYILHPSMELGGIVSKEWNIPLDRFIHLPNPFVPDQNYLNIQIWNSESEYLRITFIGKLEKRKGIFPLIEAIPEVIRRHPKVRFRFIGQAHPSPEQGLDMETYIKKRLHRFVSQLEFTGPLSYNEIPKHLAQTDICIFPSLWENFPNVCLEAMSAGRAIVGSKNGGMRDMLEDPECGLLIDPEKPNTIIEALSTFIENPGMRKSFGEKARQVILDRYNTDVIGAQTEAVYQKIIDHWH